MECRISRRVILQACLPTTDLSRTITMRESFCEFRSASPNPLKQDLSTRFNHVALQFKELPDVGLFCGGRGYLGSEHEARSPVSRASWWLVRSLPGRGGLSVPRPGDSCAPGAACAKRPGCQGSNVDTHSFVLVAEEDNSCPGFSWDSLPSRIQTPSFIGECPHRSEERCQDLADSDDPM